MLPQYCSNNKYNLSSADLLPRLPETMCFDCDYYGSNMYSYFAPSSQAAQRREERCKKEFHLVKKAFEQSLRTGGQVADTADNPMSKMTVAANSKGESPKYFFTDIVPPSLHLTSVTYPSFRKFVEENHPGWKVIRRAMKGGEMSTLPSGKQRSGKGKSFFIGFTYQKDAPPYKPRAKVSRHSCLEDDEENEDYRLEVESRPVKKAKLFPVSDEDGDKKPAAVHRLTSFSGFSGLPEQIQLHIVSYCDVETLGCVLLSSKNLNAIAKLDDVWKPHLKHMLDEFFDGSIEFRQPGLYFAPPVKDPATPLTKREDWHKSTTLLKWWNEPRHLPRSKNSEDRDISTTSVAGAGFITSSTTSRSEYQKYFIKSTAGLLQAVSTRLKTTSQSFLPKRCSFLMEDVTLCQYYLALGSLMYEYTSTQSTTFLWIKGDDEQKFCKECYRTVGHPGCFNMLPNIIWPFVAQD